MDILSTWQKFQPLPGGRWLFSRALGLVVPYAGSIHPQVHSIEPGKVKVSVTDRWSVRNHLKSIHALALVNLGELAVNLALMTVMPKDGRFIVSGLEAEYLKKARGTITTEAEVASPDWSVDGPFEAECLLRDQAGEVVTRVLVRWKVGPR
ncbi:MAG: DUF4442 domain-containing protein [Candidatus Eremiobacteraeota bacterium]|nr:DUF4442 domain-containing protein [Candidatus Eremiobacteraeota bacterium]